VLRLRNTLVHAQNAAMPKLLIIVILTHLCTLVSVAQSPKLMALKQRYAANIYTCTSICENDSCRENHDNSYYYLDRFTEMSFKDKAYYACILEELTEMDEGDDTLVFKRNSCYSEILFDTTDCEAQLKQIFFLSERTGECPMELQHTPNGFTITGNCFSGKYSETFKVIKPTQKVKQMVDLYKLKMADLPTR
jgi:hypothetical protein